MQIRVEKLLVQLNVLLLVAQSKFNPSKPLRNIVFNLGEMNNQHNAVE